jgi:hypothetical protein
VISKERSCGYRRKRLAWFVAYMPSLLPPDSRLKRHTEQRGFLVIPLSMEKGRWFSNFSVCFDTIIRMLYLPIGSVEKVYDFEHMLDQTEGLRRESK